MLLSKPHRPATFLPIRVVSGQEVIWLVLGQNPKEEEADVGVHYGLVQAQVELEAAVMLVGVDDQGARGGRGPDLSPVYVE